MKVNKWNKVNKRNEKMSVNKKTKRRMLVKEINVKRFI